MINRRNFLKKGAVLSTWSFLPSMIHEDKNKTTSKKLGLQIHSVRPQLLLDFEGTLKKIADIGFKNIEAYGLDASGLFIEKIKPLVYKKTVNNLGMNLLSTHVNYFDYENSEKVVDLCLEAGVKYAIIPSMPENFRKSINQYQRFAEYLNMVGEKFKESGITFGFHNHDYQFQKLENEIPYEILIKETEKELVTFQADLYWMTKGGADPLKFIHKFPGRYKSFHVKDIDLNGNRRSVGSGIIDFEAILNAKKVAGLKDYFVEDFRPDNSPFIKLKKSFDYLMKSNFA
ncbi:MAG: sugar phosphate isomerase/epimerase family protein [Candidatus Marivariicella sp.]